MTYDFNVDEVFQMAEQIERNGARFYRQMAETISDKSIGQLFTDFAEMEDQHEKVFSTMRADLSDKERESSVFDPEGETVMYLRALADMRVFDQNAENEFIQSDELAGEQKMRNIFRSAIHREKDSIVFYLEMKDLVSQNLGKDKIDAIIKEEMKHIRLLSNRYAALKK